MKLIVAESVIDEHKGGIARKAGYRVRFEHSDGKIITTDYFPERDEPSLEGLENAWSIADAFAQATKDKYFNVYVVTGDYCPVDGFAERALNRRL